MSGRAELFSDCLTELHSHCHTALTEVVYYVYTATSMPQAILLELRNSEMCIYLLIL